MKNKLLAIVLLLFISSTSAQTTILGGEVSGIWNKNSSPYIINGDISILTELTIEPGVHVLVADDSRIEVFGKLLAEGTQNDSIIFANNQVEWGGLHFKDSQEPSVLKFFEITGVRNIQGHGGALSIDNSKNTLVSNGAIHGNSSEYSGAGITLHNLDNFLLSNLLFYKNELFSEGGGYSARRGIAIYIGDSYIHLQNITAVKNSFSNSVTDTGSAIYWDYGSETTLTNCLIQNNDSFSIVRSNTSDPLNISYSNINGLEELNNGQEEFNGLKNLIYGEGNFDEVPKFVDFDNDNYNLLWTDPPSNKPKEIDGGAPFLHDEDGSKSDIGAVTFDQTGQYFPPSVWFDSDKNRIQSGTEVEFINNSQRGSQNILSYFWDFGDGGNSNEINPKHVYNSHGRFDVSLTIEDEQGNAITKILDQFIISGTVIGEEYVSGQWLKSNSPYIIQRDIIVPVGDLLEINPGVEVLISGYHSIRVQGDLISNGTENERIGFTALDTLYFWQRNKQQNYYTDEVEYPGWRGILFEGNNTNSFLKYSDFSYVRRFAGNYSDEFGSAVWVNNNQSFSIDHCNFQNNNANGYGSGSSTAFFAAAIRSHNSNMTITDCQFRNNHADNISAIALTDTYNSIINNCLFENNYSQLKNHVISVRSAQKSSDSDEITITNNIIQKNENGGIYAGTHYFENDPIGIIIKNNDIIENNGEGILCDGSVLVDGNRILNNIGSYEGGGITAYGGIIMNNFISGNTMDYYWSSGSAILCNAENTYIINNTITDNFHPLGVAVFGDNATYTAINNIVYNNNNGTFGQNSGAGVTPLAIIHNNSESDPKFEVDNAPLLSSESPCIDRGTLDLPIEISDKDLLGNFRRYGLGGLIDIGAVEYNDNRPIIAKINNTTCIGKDNGSLEVNAKTYGIDYEASLNTGNEQFTKTFNDKVVFEGLGTGSYELCVTNLENQKIQCYELLVNEPESLDISSKISTVESNKVSLIINGGLKPYSILLNGEKIAETSQSEVVISAIHGDLLEVFSKGDCELSYYEVINFNEDIVIYPNPTNGFLKVLLNSNRLNKYSKIPIKVTDMSGMTVFSKKVKVSESTFEIDLSSLSSNVYLITLELDTSITLRVIKQ